ncbi:hypothetical protein OAD78_06335 [Candidatus Thioglobus sp.]|nr:hypothetical protein [Candidatus Thioglobus sp.]
MTNQSNDNPCHLLICDAEPLPEITYCKVALWCGYNHSNAPHIVSIPELVEKNAETLRQRYLAWVYDLGETEIQGRRVIDHLEIRNGFSYWWMTRLVEKCNYAKSPQIDNAVKLMAFESWFLDQAITHVKLESSNSLLAQCLSIWCVNMGLVFEWQSLPDKVAPIKLFAIRGTEQTKEVSWIKRIYQTLPSNLKGIIWLINYLVRRWPLKGAGLKKWSQSKGKVTFVSYLFNLVPDALNIGKFESYYWAHLPDVLQNDVCPTNWLHIYLKSPLIPNVSKAAEVIKQFNAEAKGEQVHVTLDTFLGWRVLLKVLQDWRVVHRAVANFRQIPVNCSKDVIVLWPLFVDDWEQSFTGVEALNNILNLSLYEAAMTSLPTQRVGVYLQENQGWEFAFVHAWQAAGHGNLIGAPHSSVRFWDLRYYFDSRSYDRRLKNNLPLPDLVAVNGSEAMLAFIGGAYPVAKLRQVEALRYLYLTDYSDVKPRVQRPLDSPLRVLVMGDHLLEDMQLQMHLLEHAAEMLSKDTIFVIKPHPACPVNLEHYQRLGMRVSMEPLLILLEKCDVAYVSGITSAAVDAYVSGVPIISVIDPKKLNLSPLRGCARAIFINTQAELANALMSNMTLPLQVPETTNYFCLDTAIPRWRGLLKVETINAVPASQSIKESSLNSS